MQEASFSGLIRDLVYLIAIYYIIKFLARLLLPLLVKKVVEKTTENFQQQQQQTRTNSWQKTQNGDEVTIDASKAKKPRETKKVGDYVDYEEID